LTVESWDSSVARKWSAYGILQLLLIKMFMARCRCRCRCPMADDFCWSDMNHHKSKCGINIYRDFIIMPGQAKLTNMPCMLCSSHNNSNHYNNNSNKEHIWHAWESHAVQTDQWPHFIFYGRQILHMAELWFEWRR